MSEQETDQVTDNNLGDEDQQQSLELTTPDDASPTASDSEDNHEQKIEFTPEQQKVVNDIAAKKAYEAREAKRRAEEAEKRIAELEAKLPREQEPVVPELPDPYDDDYEAKIAQRDEALRLKAQYDAQALIREQEAQRQAQERQRQEQEELYKAVESYTDRAKKLGISESELQAAGNLVSQYGINDQITQHILGDEQGPIITKYLSQNPTAMDTINSLPPIKAAIYIETQLKPEAMKLKPQTTTAPEPVETLAGAGISEKRGPKGATFE